MSSEIIFEPFRIKVVEPIRLSTEDERRQWLADAGYNVFLLRSEQVVIDLLTDSGTAAMSQEQWAALQAGDESYAGSKSYFELEAVAQELFQKRVIIPVHQGRAGEHLVFHELIERGAVVPSNGHFDTTAANVRDRGGTPLNLPCAAASQLRTSAPFKGDIDLPALKALLESHHEQIPFVLMTITNNTGGGQPVSFANLSAVKELCTEFRKPLIIDGCRFAENAYFIKMREHGFADESPKAIAQRVFALADIVTFSGKKDALSNIGGLVCLYDEELAERLKNRLVVTEGFSTYGGLAGRDLAAMAQGLREVVEPSYLHYRIRTIEWMVERLDRAKVPVLIPAGGHGLYIDAAAFFTHLSPEQFPGIALVNELYLRGGIRAVELGNVAFGSTDESGKPQFPPHDLVRLAMPRRVYTEAHAGYVVEIILSLFRQATQVRGYRFVKEAPVLRHFRSTFAPLD
ncbi:MAG: tryptophanase [Bdellovibrionales bacterium]|nr:tryptophanase [Bdellovibrionales bacterium]